MERIPFDYDKYAADPDSWSLFTAEGNQVVFVIETTESDVDYPLKGVYKSPEGHAEEAIWTKEGHFVTTDTGSLKNITHMIAVKKVKPVETIKVTSSLTTRLRNVYYDRKNNCIRVGIKSFELWTDAMKASVLSCLKNTDLEHLCIVNLEDHPQIREMLIDKGLSEVTYTEAFKEEHA